MLLLALDTSTRHSSIALCTETELYSEFSWSSTNNHSVELLQYSQRMMSENNLTWQQLDAIAVATGPGSFNGVRVALAMAKSLAHMLQKPLIGISSLDIIAAQQFHLTGPLCVLQEAGRSEFYTAWYRYELRPDDTGLLRPHLQRLGDYFLGSSQQVAAHFLDNGRSWLSLRLEDDLPSLLLCGEISETSRQALHQALTVPHTFMGSMIATRRASGLAFLAWERLRNHLLDDPLVLEPLYIRRPSITKSTRKRALLGTPEQRTSGSLTTEREEGAIRH